MSSQKCEIPKHVLQELTRAFADDIVAFFENEEGQREYEERFGRLMRKDMITKKAIENSQ